MNRGQSYSAYTRDPRTPQADLSRAIFGGIGTPLPEIVAPTLDRLPADIGAQLTRDFWKRHDAGDDWTTKHAAQNWLATEVAEFEREKIHRAFDEPEIRTLAERWSQLCGRMVRLEPMQDFARSVGIDPPEVRKNVTRIGAASRLCCPRWWRRQIRKQYTRRAESHLRARGFVHRRRQVYASDRAVENRRQRKTRDKALLQDLLAVSSEGDRLELWSVVEKSQANPAIRRAELMTRLRGFEEVAQAAGHVAEFVTLTCPSAFHRTHDNGTQNERWQGFTPREGQQWLCKQWARARAKLQRLSLRVYGFRIAEPHHDGTPHWHMVLFVPAHAAETLRTLLRGVWLSEFGSEPGADKYRANFVRIDPAKGSACGYLAKYVAKNIDGFEVGDDYETEGKRADDSCDRVAAWAAAHGIRQFQQIGGPSVCVWRELRRIRVRLDAVPAAAIEAARAAADAGQWADFIAAIGGIASCNARAGTVQLWREVTGELSQYGELRAPQIAGVQACGTRTQEGLSGVPVVADASGTARHDAPANPSCVRVRTRCKVWRIQRKAAGQGKGTDSKPRPAGRVPSHSGPLPSLGPVSITVRDSESVPSRPVAGAHASPANRGPPWIH